MGGIEINLPEVQLPPGTITFVQRILGPFAEAGDFLSEKIRFYRWKSSLAVMQEAERIARERGIDAKTVPLKTLVPLLEKASLEEPESPLISKWATLLAGAAHNPDYVKSVFGEILSRMSASEIAILERMVPQTQEIENSSTVIGYVSGYHTATIETVVKALTGDDAPAAREEAQERLIGVSSLLTPTVIIETVLALDDGIRPNNAIFVVNSDIDEKVVSYEMLIISGLLGRHVTNVKCGSYDLKITTLNITPMAYEFVCACRGDKLPEARE